MKNTNVPVRKSLFVELYNCFRIATEYFLGILKFRDLTPCITIYGSARLEKDSKEYIATVKLGELITKAGFNIITGGGPGIMQAANEGAFSSKMGKSAGCSIYIPHETYSNPFLEYHHHCNYFFVRKVLLTRFSSGFVALPGGLGTLDELFEMLTLIKTHRIKNFPIILFDSKFWSPLINFMNEQMLPLGTINKDEISSVHVTDNVEEVVQIINKYHEK